VRADHDVHLPATQPGGDLPLLLRRAEVDGASPPAPGKRQAVAGSVLKCCCASTVVGPGWHLPAFKTALKAARSATSVLPLPDVAADQTVHRALALHIKLDLSQNGASGRRFRRMGSWPSSSCLPGRVGAELEPLRL